MEEKQDYTSVEILEDGDLILVGEEHRNTDSRRLVEEVVEEVEPKTIAVEADKRQERGGSSGGMGWASDWAREEGKPIYSIDRTAAERRRELAVRANGVANEFPHPLQENGDVDIRGPTEARANFKDEFGIEAHRIMYEDREVDMARRLNTALDEMETPIVAVTGVYHTQALAELVPVLNRFVQLDRGRIEETEESLRTESEEAVAHV